MPPETFHNENSIQKEASDTTENHGTIPCVSDDHTPSLLDFPDSNISSRNMSDTDHSIKESDNKVTGFSFPLAFGKLDPRLKKEEADHETRESGLPMDPDVLRSLIRVVGNKPKTKNREQVKQDDLEDELQSQADQKVVRPVLPHNFIPLASSCKFEAHQKSVTTLAVNPKATRFITGGHDGEIRLWDFGGMTCSPNSFRRFTPVSGYGIRSISFSPTGYHFVCAAGDAVARIYDVEGAKVQETVKGDMYVRDLNQTKGHTHAISDCEWHPFDREKFLSASSDATIRIFDITTKLYGIDQALPQIQAIDKRNLNIAGHCRVTCARWQPMTAKYIIGGCSDGSIQLWNERRVYGKPDKIVRAAHQSDSEITSIKILKDAFRLVSRSTDNTMKLWDLRNFKEPVHQWDNLPNNVSGLGVALNSLETLVLTGTSSKSSEAFIKSYELVKEIPVSSNNTGAFSVISLAWPETLNQIIFGGSDGHVRILYDTEHSQKGALFFVNRPAISRQRALEGFQAPIFTPDDLPEGLKQTRTGEIKRVKLEDGESYTTKSQKTIVPTKPPEKTPKTAVTVMGHLSISRTKDQDPVEALRAYADMTQKEPIFVTNAYKKTQPKPVLDYSMEACDAEKMIVGMHKCPQCGLKLCRCGHMRALGIKPPDSSKNRKFDSQR